MYVMFGFISLGKGVQIGLGRTPDLGERGVGVDLMLYPEGDFDIDGYYEQVRGNGVPIVSELKTEYWGDRVFSIKDADGYSLTFGVTVHHPSIEEIQEHMRAAPVSA